MSAIATLRDLFSQQVRDANAGDSDLPALARLVLSESIKVKGDLSDVRAFVSDAEQRNRDIETAAKEALTLLSLWNEGKTATPKTLRVILDALLKGWVSSFIEPEFEKKIVDALLGLEVAGEEEGQLEEALRVCGKDHLRYQPDKLLRIIVGTTVVYNRTVVHWAFKKLTSVSSLGHLRFAAACLLACGGSSDTPPELEEAAKYHIIHAAKTLEAAKEMRFTDVPGGPSMPMGRPGELTLRTSTLVEYVWVTSKMNERLNKSAEGANAWLNAAESQVTKRMGTAEKRSFDVKLTVRIYPHVSDWYGRRSELEPLQTLSHTV